MVVEIMDTDASTESSVPNLAPKPRPLPWLRATTDAALVVLAAVVVEVLCKTLGPVENGFYCGDRRIGFPLKLSTVSGTALLIYCVCVNIVVVIAVELLMLNIHPSERYSIYEHQRRKWQRFLIRVVIFLGYYAAFEMFVEMLTLSTKHSIGRLRPYFLAACQPNYDKSVCDVPGAFVLNYTCTSGLSERIREARLSFFSGHSSLSVATSTFGILILLISALYISYSRIFDYKHHFTDVAVGVGVGFLVMILLCRFVAGFRWRPASEVEAELVKMELSCLNGGLENGRTLPSAKSDFETRGMSTNRSFYWSEAYS